MLQFDLRVSSVFLDILSEKGALIIWFLFSERKTITQTIKK